MAKLPAPYVCDFDSTQKKESNHWFLVHLDPFVFWLTAWENGDPDETGVKHACSEQCVGKAFNQWAEMRRTAAAEAPNPTIGHEEEPTHV